MKFGLALSGGALRGVAHIGILKALHENKLYPSWISGTSAGSIIASLYACGYSPEQMEKIAYTIKKDIFDLDCRGISTDVLHWLFKGDIKTDGLIKGKRLENLIKKLTKERKLRDAKLPLAITAVNINNGQNVLFVSNKDKEPDDKNTKIIENAYIYEAVRASIAIPVVFKPKMFKGMRLVDGGLSENLPINALKLIGANIIIGVNLGYSGQMRKEVDNILEIGSQAIDVMGYYITSLKSSDADLIINPHLYDIGMTELHKIGECINRGYKYAMDNMNLIKRTINRRYSTPSFYKNFR